MFQVLLAPGVQKVTEDSRDPQAPPARRARMDSQALRAPPASRDCRAPWGSLGCPGHGGCQASLGCRACQVSRVPLVPRAPQGRQCPWPLRLSRPQHLRTTVSLSPSHPGWGCTPCSPHTPNLISSEGITQSGLQPLLLAWPR